MNPFARFSTLQITLGISIALHVALFTVRFVDPERFNRVFKDTPLEVILVNAKPEEQQEPPEKPAAFAQHTLAGGGSADEGRATSPLLYSDLTAIGNDLEDAQRKIDNLLQAQRQLLTQVRQQLAALPAPEPHTPEPNRDVLQQKQHEDEKRKQLQKLLAEIEKRIAEENARPRKRYVSPATMARVDAVYYDILRRKIEEKGTRNFPEHQGKKLYGELVMIVTVNHDGNVLSTEVAQSSGNPRLDRQAKAIAREAGPFGHFGSTMRAHADQIALVSRFKFIRDESGKNTFETQVSW